MPFFQFLEQQKNNRSFIRHFQSVDHRVFIKVLLPPSYNCPAIYLFNICHVVSDIFCTKKFQNHKNLFSKRFGTFSHVNWFYSDCLRVWICSRHVYERNSSKLHVEFFHQVFSGRNYVDHREFWNFITFETKWRFSCWEFCSLRTLIENLCRWVKYLARFSSKFEDFEKSHEKLCANAKLPVIFCNVLKKIFLGDKSCNYCFIEISSHVTISKYVFWTFCRVRLFETKYQGRFRSWYSFQGKNNSFEQFSKLKMIVLNFKLNSSKIVFEGVKNNSHLNFICT